MAKSTILEQAIGRAFLYQQNFLIEENNEIKCFDNDRDGTPIVITDGVVYDVMKLTDKYTEKQLVEFTQSVIEFAKEYFKGKAEYSDELEKEEFPTGPITGISYSVIADQLGIRIAQIAKAKSEGCDTYEKLIEYYNL